LARHMSQLRTFYQVVGQDERRQRASSLLGERRVSEARCISSAQRSNFVRVVSHEEKEEGDSNKSSEESDEETGSEYFDAGCTRDVVEDTSGTDDEEPLEASLRRQSMRTASFLDRLKAKRSTKSNFGFNVNLACKGAVFVVLGNLPMLVQPVQVMIPEQFWPVLGYVGLYLVFTFWRTLGDTIAYAFQGIAGAVLGNLNVLLTTTLIGGTTPKSNLQFCFVWLHFVTYIGLVLWLNVDDNTRNVALCTHVSYFMLVLKPEDPNLEKNLLKGFTLEEFKKLRVEVVNFSVVVVGILLALLAASLPLVPVLPSTYDFKVGDALRYAEEEVQDLTYAMSQLVLDAVKGFGAHSESLVVDSFIAQAEHMHVRLQKLDVLGGAAWWEVIFPGSSHRRLRLRVTKDMHEILISVLDNVIILLYTLKYEDFQPSHQDMMDEIEVPLEDLAQFFVDELNKAMETLLQAQSDLRQASRKDVLREKKHLITELGEAYIRTLDEIVGMPLPVPDDNGFEEMGRRSTGSSSKQSWRSQGSFGDARQRRVEVLQETMEESHFVYRLILMTDRLIARLERQEPSQEDARSRCSLLVSLIRHVTDPDVLFNQKHVIFALRQSITIVVSFIICMRYYNYSPTMAATQSLLVNEGGCTGSMLRRNLGRLQGVVIGTIFPHLFFDWFSECSFAHEFTLVVILFFFEWISLYVYFSSEDFGYVGCLVGAFGASALCQGCGMKPNTKKSLYLTMEQNAVGIALLTVIDLVFAPERASDLANKNMCHDREGSGYESLGNLPLLQYGMAAALQMESQPGDQDGGSPQQRSEVVRLDHFGDWNRRAISQFRESRQLCDEANSEPRYMRRQWPYKLYAEATTVCQGLRVDIIALTDAIILQHAVVGAEEDVLFAENQEFKKFIRKLVRAFNRVSHMVTIALKHFDEESGEMARHQADIHQEAEQLKIPTDEDISRLSRSLVDRFELWKARDSKRRLSVRSHVLTDTFCRVSVAVCVLKNITRRMQRLHTIVVDAV